MKRAFTQIHIAVLLWGFTGILGKAISLSAPVLVWYRMLISAIVLAVILSYRRDWRAIVRKDLLRVVIVGILFAAHWVSFYASIKYANASIAMVCLATVSAFTAFLDPIINKGKFNYQEVFLSFIAVTGVFCIYKFQPEASQDAMPMQHFKLGVVLGVLASVLSAAFTVLNKPLASQYRPRTLVFYEMAIGFVFLSCIAPFYLAQQPGNIRLVPHQWDYLWLFLLSYCCTVWAQSLSMAALKNLSAFTVTLSVNLEPVYGIILAFLIFKENTQLGYGFYLGMAFIFLSLILQILIVTLKARAIREI